MAKAKMKLTVTGAARPFDTDVKRFYVPGVVLKSHCPKCAAPSSIDLNNEYLSYPKANAPYEVEFYCDCGHEWGQQVKLVVTVESI